MKDLTSPAWIKAKGLLFLLLGSLSAVLVFLERSNLEWRLSGGRGLVLLPLLLFRVLRPQAMSTPRIVSLDFSLSPAICSAIPVANLERTHLRPGTQPQPKAYS